MTIEAMSSLPLQAGGAVAAAAGRTAMWAISAYMRQPLRNTATAALIGLSLLAGANALYKQAHHHPAPLFGSFSSAPARIVTKKAAPVLPAARPRKLAEPVSDETTGSVAQPVHVGWSPSSADVTVLQQKLHDLGFYSSSVDGLFGPRTARAVKAFEASIGQPANGQLTADLMTLVRGAPVPAAQPAVTTPAPAAQPVAVVAEVQAPAITDRLPTLTSVGPLPVPAPLLPTTTPAALTAASAIDSATASSEPPPEALAMTEQNVVPKRMVPTIAVHASTAPVATAEDGQAMPDALGNDAVASVADASTDSDVVSAVQRGLNSLGFLHAPVDGVAGEATAKAIRNFEVYFNYNVTGRVTRQLVNMLEQNGAVI